MSENQALLTTNRKALTINMDGNHYGTIAEIGAGQEVSRVFFQAGGASGSIAKTMSAYDMTFSDSIYGKAPRYVSRERLQTMLQHEYSLLKERLFEKRGDRTRFFVFADTVATTSARSRGADGHGWLGIRFQVNPLEEPNDIIIHVRMWDRKNLQQQEALGIVGVNLIYAAFHYLDDPEKFILSLVDNVGTDRIEVDMLKFSGPSFAHLDNRLLSLSLVKHGLTNAVLFSASGDVLHPAEILYNRPVMVERGKFRPVTHVNVDLLNCATAQFFQEPMVKDKDVLVVMEITMNNLLSEGSLDVADFLSRVDMLGHIGFAVLISNFLDYDNLEGGILESMGRMFRHAVKLYAYPRRRGTLHESSLQLPQSTDSSDLITAANFKVSDNLRHLYAHLRANRAIECITGYDEDFLEIYSRDVLTRLRSNDPSWERMVPAKVAQFVKERGLFGYAPPPQPPTADPGKP